MPMKPAAAEARPADQEADRDLDVCSGISATKRTAPTIAIVVYWRRR
jgi:hypothetical protein